MLSALAVRSFTVCDKQLYYGLGLYTDAPLISFHGRNSVLVKCLLGMHALSEADVAVVCCVTLCIMQREIRHIAQTYVYDNDTFVLSVLCFVSDLVWAIAQHI
jgi:hypothetical protein